MADHSQTISRGPSAEEWGRHKKAIVELYLTKSLSEVMSEMRTKHKFYAT